MSDLFLSCQRLGKSKRFPRSRGQRRVQQLHPRHRLHSRTEETEGIRAAWAGPIQSPVIWADRRSPPTRQAVTGIRAVRGPAHALGPIPGPTPRFARRFPCERVWTSLINSCGARESRKRAWKGPGERPRRRGGRRPLVWPVRSWNSTFRPQSLSYECNWEAAWEVGAGMRPCRR